MKNKLISIIVPMYNSSSTIERCLNSLKNQSYKNIEIIVINDGSTDNSSEICRKMIKKDKRIKIYEKVNQGVSSARNLGLSHAKGDFIGFVDSDDYIEEKMYEELLEMIMKTKSKMAICNLYFENNKESEILKFKYKDIIFDSSELPFYMFNYLSINGFLCNKLYSRDLIFNKNGNIEFDESIKILEDNLFNYKILENSKLNFMCAYIEKKMYHYVQYKSSACNKTYTLNNLKYFEVRKKQIEILESAKRDSNFLKIDYIINFVKMKIKMELLDFEKNDEFYMIYEQYINYLKTTDCKNIATRLKIKYIIAKYFPIIYKILIITRKENI